MLNHKNYNIFLLISILLIPTVVKALYWKTYTLDVNGNVGLYTSIAIDNNGYPHISYYDGSNGALKYIYKSSNGWHIETIDDPDNATVGWWTSLALDANGNPHISYVDYTHRNLKYAHKLETGEWQIETVDEDRVGTTSTSIALDANGNPYITYHSETNNGVLKLAYKTEGEWHTMIVDQGNRIGYFSSLKLDAQGNPHVSYVDDYYDELKFVHKVYGSWLIEVVDIHSNPRYTSLALDVNGDPHISYYDDNEGNLKYAYKLGGIWFIENVDIIGDVGEYSSLALDSNGNPHITYYDNSEYYLKYAYKINGEWYIEVVDSSNCCVGVWTSLSLDTNGNPHISYFDDWENNLKYAESPGEYKIVYPNGGERWFAGELQTIKWLGEGIVDIYFSPDGLNYQLLARNASGGSFTIVVPDVTTNNALIKIVNESIPYWEDVSDSSFSISPSIPYRTFYESKNIDNSLYPSIALDVDNNPHICYRNISSGHLKYEYKQGGNWYSEDINLDGIYISMKIDGYGIPNIVFNDINNNRIVYTYKTPNYWDFLTFNNAGPYAPTLDLDQYGNPHFCYVSSSNSLMYIYRGNDGSTYYMANIANGVGPSLKVDKNGYPHLCYVDLSLSHLYYGSKKEDGWNFETIESASQGHDILDPSLEIDNMGNPHISYINGALKYAYKSNGDWHFEIVDEDGGYLPSLALDENGNPYIVYISSTNDIMYAYKMQGEWILKTLDEVSSNVCSPQLAVDVYRNPHVVYSDAQYSKVKYKSSAIALFSPTNSEIWDVGANEVIKWGGPRNVDIYISIQGGDDWLPLVRNAVGTAVGDTWEYTIQIPHIPTHYAKLKIVYAGYDPSNPSNCSISSDFFTIRSDITLLQFTAKAESNGRVKLSWETQPGLEDLSGYNLYRVGVHGEEVKVNGELITAEMFEDEPTGVVTGYTLEAVNGLGEKYRVGYIPYYNLDKPLKISPNIVLDYATITFYVPSLNLSSKKEHVTLSIVDISGKVVKRILDKNLSPGVHVVNIGTKSFKSGMYFAVLRINGIKEHAVRFQLVKIHK